MPCALASQAVVHFVRLARFGTGKWTVQEGHTWAERIEVEIHHFLPRAHVTTHLEPLEDPVSMIDQEA
ncbi:cation transporter dimerization domain-containing protein [Candidatus Accumulibacter sp. ACC012]|uniref:cation transporter dimerization domain-containing protein n=1 Tax=Candidatus Accumulibacter sp. ACC012 TaxID=2823332 RepID=UPI0025B9E63E|nr:cation transporter dimerization domain-containing protein [Candidatus Accumulibacter sp. ACC012]